MSGHCPLTCDKRTSTLEGSEVHIMAGPSILPGRQDHASFVVNIRRAEATISVIDVHWLLEPSTVIPLVDSVALIQIRHEKSRGFIVVAGPKERIVLHRDVEDAEASPVRGVQPCERLRLAMWVVWLAEVDSAVSTVQQDALELLNVVVLACGHVGHVVSEADLSATQIHL